MTPMRVGLLLVLLAAPALAETPAEAPPRPVVSEIVTTETAPLRRFPGVIGAETETALAFQTAGRLASRPVERGDRVAAGDLLATLDEVTLAEDLALAEAALDSAVAEADLARQSLERVMELSRRGVAAQAQLEAAQAQADATAAQVEAARANRDRARNAEGFGRLTAPDAGIVTRVLADPGSQVAAGTPVLSLATGTGREALIDVPDEVLALLDPGARFTVSTRQPGAQPVGGTLRLIEPVASPGARTHRLRIRLDEGAQALRIGALVFAQVDAGQDPILTLPPEALMGDGVLVDVWVVGPDRKAERRKVSLGATVAGRLVVETGLAAGEEVVVRGVNSIRDGQQLGARIAGE